MKKISSTLKSLLLIGLVHGLTIPAAFAQGAPVASQATSPLAITLIFIMLALLLIIGLLAYVLLGVADMHLNKFREATKKGAIKVAVILLFANIFSLNVMAQDKAAKVTTPAVTSYDGLSAFSYNTMVFIIGLEVLVIIVMCLFVQNLLAKEKIKLPVAIPIYTEPLWKVWWEKINNFKPIGVVQDTGHDYDGIRELDNRLPPWWSYGFIACIIFSIVYLYRFQVVHTGPSPLQEYEVAMNEAAAEKDAYLLHAASKVDENSVVMLTDVAALGDGKKLFETSCSPCHGANAQGVVGPNLTDDFWMHEGGIKDVFKTIKYGVPEKGMKAWKDDFNPVQIAQLASYIKSLKGSKPAGAKEPQGVEYKELVEAATSAVKSEKSIVKNP